jgi:hypothetical protein
MGRMTARLKAANSFENKKSAFCAFTGKFL